MQNTIGEIKIFLRNIINENFGKYFGVVGKLRENSLEFCCREEFTDFDKKKIQRNLQFGRLSKKF